MPTSRVRTSTPNFLQPGTLINQYGESLNVASGILTTVSQYTVPNGEILYLQQVDVSGSNIALWIVLVNGITVSKRRTYFGDLNSFFEFEASGKLGFQVNAGQTVAVQVLHNRPFVGDFEARITGLQQP